MPMLVNLLLSSESMFPYRSPAEKLRWQRNRNFLPSTLLSWQATSEAGVPGVSNGLAWSPAAPTRGHLAAHVRVLWDNSDCFLKDPGGFCYRSCSVRDCVVIAVTMTVCKSGQCSTAPIICSGHKHFSPLSQVS